MPNPAARAAEAIAPERMGRSFRLLRVSSLITNVGDGIALAAGPLLVASQTRDPLLVSFALLAQNLPALLFGFMAGVVADRVDRVRLIRATLYALGFIVVIAVLGLVASPWALLAVPAATLFAFAFAAVGMAATTFMRSWQDFDLIQLVVLPLFLFSGTFYPISAYPEPLRLFVQITPLYQGVDLIRALVTGAVDPGIIVHVVYLAVMGLLGLAVVARRLDKLLLK